MSEKKRSVLFSVLTVVATAVVFFALGLAAAEAWGVSKKTIVIETIEPEITTTTAVELCLDLNMATVEDLVQIPGLGEKTAQSIIDYREEIGGFQYVEQLQYVQGIGDVKYNSWIAYFTVNGVGVGSMVVSTGTSSVATTSTTVFIGKYHLNRVTLEELKTINGVGDKTAESILRYREQIGGFSRLEQLLEIDGIGEKRFAVLCEYLTLDDE